MKNKVGYEEPKILKRRSCRSKTERKDREEKSSIYQKLNKAFLVLRAKRPVHPDQEELEEQRRKVLKVFKEFIKEDQILKNFKLDQIGRNMDEDMELNKKNKGVEKKPEKDMKAISSQETPAASDEQAIYVETLASEPSGNPSKAPSQIQPSEPPSKAPSQMQTTETQKTPSRLAQNSEIMDKTSQKKKYDSIHLSDSTVLEELRVADQRAKNAAKMLESVKEHISKNAEKEEMTEEDIQLMQRKQAELMEKMSEFEEITKRVQQLVGLRDVSSSHLGLPSKPVLNRKSDKCVEELPKVIVCGPGMDQIPKIIVCEPAGKEKKPIVHETMEPVKAKKGVQYKEEPHYRGQTPEDSMRQLVSAVQQTSQHYQPTIYSPPSSPQNFGYPEPFVYQQNPAYIYGQQQYDQQYGQQPYGNVQQYGHYPEGYNADPYETEMGDQTSVEQGYDDMQQKQREQMEQRSQIADKQTTYTEPLQRTEGAMCRAEVYQNLGLPIPPGVNPNCPAALLNSLMGGMPGNNVICKADLWKAMKKGGGTCVPNCPGAQGMGDVPPGVCKKRMKSQKWKKEKHDMDSIVKSMEEEVRSIQKELELVQAERRGLDLQKKLLSCATAAPSAPTNGQIPSHISKPTGPKSIPQMPAYKGNHESLSALECQLSTLREKYKKLQEDYNNKVEEISMIRVEFNAAKRDNMALLEKSEEAEARADDLLERLKAAEDEKIKVVGSKDQIMEMEQKMVFAQQRYREGQEEIEEMRTNMQDLMLQLEDYRNKYLNAQQTVEEQRRQLDIMELENNRIGEQVNLEIQRVKTQFQEKLQELTPLPDMLKATQMKLQETQQLRIIAERTVEQMKKEMDELKEKHEAVNEELEGYKKDTTNLDAEKVHLKNSLTTGEKRIEEIKAENAKLRATLARLEEVTLKNERRFDEKNHETIQLQTQLETLREESARQVARTKDRCETVRRSLQSQISELERQLAQSRAAARTAQKDRDEIRQKMQAQITSLNDNFEQAQLRIRSLQSHVNYLKNSYTNLFSSDQSNIPILDKKSS